MTYRYFILGVDLVELAAVKDNCDTCILDRLECTHLRLSYKAPVLPVGVGFIAVHRELYKHKRKLIVCPIISPKLNKRLEQLEICLRSVVIGFTLIVDNTLDSIRAYTLYHTVIKRCSVERI